MTATTSITVISDFTQACTIGQQLAKDEDDLRWRLAELCAVVVRGKEYGSSRVEKFAKAIDRSKSFVYDYANLATFYDSPEAQETLSFPFATFQKARLIMRYTSDKPLGLYWLDRTVGNAYTYEQLGTELEQEFKGKLPPNEPIVSGVYMRSQLRDLINKLPAGRQYKVRIEGVE